MAGNGIGGNCSNLSYDFIDAFPFPTRPFLDPHLILEVERFLELYEKISFIFLYFDDIEECLRICHKCINDQNYPFLSENNLRSRSNWIHKVFECLFYIKHFLLLRKLGVRTIDKDSKYPKYIQKKRLILYQICENLTLEDTSKVMTSVSSLSSEKYTEIYILKVLSCESDYNNFKSSLAALKNVTINRFLEELDSEFMLSYKLKSSVLLRDSSPKKVNFNKDDVYPIKDPNNVGLCLIINIFNVKGHDKREGSLKDVSLLEETMKYFKFNVKIFHDVDEHFFTNDLKIIINESFKDNHSIFLMAVLSHGQEGMFFCSTGKAVPINFLKNELSCKKLFNIPKVLVVQACQGVKFLIKGPVSDGPRVERYRGPELTFDYHVSDFLLAVSTVPGFRAFRDVSEGTWFIQTLCKCLKENENDNILNIMTKTIKIVKELLFKKRRDESEVGQQPTFSSILDKQLYLKL